MEDGGGSLSSLLIRTLIQQNRAPPLVNLNY